MLLCNVAIEITIGRYPKVLRDSAVRAIFFCKRLGADRYVTSCEPMENKCRRSLRLSRSPPRGESKALYGAVNELQNCRTICQPALRHCRGADQLSVKTGVTEQKLVGLGSLVIQVQVVFPREADSAVGLHS